VRTPAMRDPIATGELLRTLLMQNPRYRRRWQTYATRARNALNQAAIAEVIALDLWERGERADSSTDLARSLKDRVSRALNGQAISTETLSWFISAFEMDRDDESRLMAALSGRPYPELGISRTMRERRALVQRQSHRTVSIFERYVVDLDGSLETRHTLHVIRATEDGVRSYIFNHEQEASFIDVIHGGRLGSKYQYGGGLCAVEIVLTRPLGEGETTSLEYKTTFRKGNLLNEVRRAAFGRSENIDFAVEFQGELPRQAFWCVWEDHILGQPVEEDHATFRGKSIRKYIPFIEETVVGFRWSW
jgi:hypothetical protein